MSGSSSRPAAALPFAMPQKSPPAPQAAVARLLRDARSASWKRSSSSARPTSATPCRSTCATSSRACSRPSRTSGRCTASSWRSPKAARARRAAACSTATRRRCCARCSPSTARAGCRTSAGRCAGWRGCCAAIRPTPSARSGMRFTRDRRFVGHGFKRQVPVGPHITDFVSFPLRVVIDLVPADEAADGRQGARRAAGVAHRARLSRGRMWRWPTSRRMSATVLERTRGRLARQPFSVLSCAAVPARRKPRSLPTARKRTPRLAQATARSALAQ